MSEPSQADVQRALRLLTAFALTPEGFRTLQESQATIVILAAVERLSATLDTIAQRAA